MARLALIVLAVLAGFHPDAAAAGTECRTRAGSPVAEGITAESVRLDLACAALAQRDPWKARNILAPVALPGTKAGYLANQVTKYLAATQPKAPKEVTVLDLAVACHNVFLFVRARGVPVAIAEPWAEEGLTAYGKVMAGGPKTDAAFARGASAGLLAEIDRVEDGEARLATLRAEELDRDVRDLLLAYVHSAFGRRDQALRHLEEALRRNPEAIRFWIRLSDDFYRLRGDPAYLHLLHESEALGP